MKTIIYTSDLQNENNLLEKFISEKLKHRYGSVEKISSNSRPLSKLHKQADYYYKSLYGVDSNYKNYKDFSWIMTGTLIGYQKPEKSHATKKKCLIFTIGRTGTVFAEKILQNYYDEVISHVLFDYQFDFNQEPIDIFFIYRKNLLSHFTSLALAFTAGYNHQSEYDYRDVLIFKKDYSRYVYQIGKRIIRYFNTTCNLILSNQSTNFYLLEFEDMIQNYSGSINHTAVNYGKEKTDLFEDYTLFKKKCLPAIEILEFYRKNWLDKLDQLKVPFIKNFNNFDKTSE